MLPATDVSQQLGLKHSAIQYVEIDLQPGGLAMAPEAARQVLEETLQRVNVPCFIGDADGRIVWLNDAA